MRRNYHSLKQQGAQLQPLFVGDPPDLNMAAVALVRATDILPTIDEWGSVTLDTGINGDRPTKLGFRNSIHFALNHHVNANNGGDWNAQPYVIVAGFEETLRPIQHFMTNAGLAVATMEGIHLGAFHPVDTWFCLGFDAKLELPHAAVIAPEGHDPSRNALGPSLKENELFKMEGNRTTYKSLNYTTNDFVNVLAKSPAMARQLSYNNIKEEMVGEMVAAAKEYPGFKLNTILRQAGYDSATIQTVNGIMLHQIKEMATIHTLEAKGHPYMSAAEHNWQGISINSVEDKAIEAAAKTEGAVMGAARYHRHTPYTVVEDTINALLNDSSSDKAPRLNGLVADFNGVESTHAMRIESALNDPVIDQTTRIAALSYLKERMGVRWEWKAVHGAHHVKLLPPKGPSPQQNNAQHQFVRPSL